MGGEESIISLIFILIFMSRNGLRWSVERFWHPFMTAKTGACLSSYRFRENVDSIRTPDEDFTCQVNGEVGGVRLLENFFSVLLCGFDISDVFFGWKSSICDPNGINYSGRYVLSHSRPFLGWEPTSCSYVGRSTSGKSFVKTAGSNVTSSAKSGLDSISDTHSIPDTRLHYASRRGDSIQLRDELSPIEVPFSMHVEGGGSQELLSHIVFSSPAFMHVSRMPDCPSNVKECLADSKALKLIAALRLAQVDPTFITAEAVLKAAKSADNWVGTLNLK